VGLQNLEKLVGRWSIDGEWKGVSTYRWAQGKRFLFQDFDIHSGERRHVGLEVIGHLQPMGTEPTPEIWSRAYFFNSGHTLDYVYEMEGQDLTIWFRHRGSDNRLRGRYSPDGTGFSGAWEWPGGGYEVQGRRLD
jgi:hypothetical protein